MVGAVSNFAIVFLEWFWWKAGISDGITIRVALVKLLQR